MAKTIVTSRETVSRALADMRRDGIVGADGRSIVVFA
ncbi:MAG: winged helix-turn-helix domain-containing protein [Candidatus Dormibacteraeota bacterium]|nr:winged helix-turn-helix domain-containing protein [Candidatus Dormibacteraeota bacterium]